MGQKKVKVILKKVSKDDEKGYLRISIRENKKTTIKNIKLPPIEIKYWNPLKQVVKSTFSEYRVYNEEINNALEELKTNNEVSVTKSKLLFIESCRDILENKYKKLSTKLRYNTILRSFENFIKFNYSVDDIPIYNLNPLFFDEYVTYIINQKISGQNNIRLSISVIKSFLKKLEKSNDLNLPPNFYDKIVVLKSLPKKKKILPKDDFFKILNTSVEDKILEQTRQIFLFQTFASGLRHSDVSTLRFSDFLIDNNKGIPEIRFVKVQKKTSKIISTMVSYRAVKLLANFLPVDGLTSDEQNKLKYYVSTGNPLNDNKGIIQDLNDIKYTVNVNLENDIIKRHFFNREITASVNDLTPLAENHTKALIFKYKNQGLDDVTIDLLISRDENLSYFKLLIEFVKKRVKEKIEDIKENELNLNLDFYKIIAKILRDCKENRPLDFVFPLLRSIDFKDIISGDGFSNVNLRQQLIMKKTLDNFNLNLSRLCDELKIPKISTHYARNAFGSLLVDLKGINIDMYSLREAMGHTSVTQTENYLHSLSNGGKDDLGKLLSDNT
jgi:integrase